MTFWNELKAPFFSLAPMEDVTDTVFREIVLQNSSPGNLGVVFTEFVSTDGLCHPVGREKVKHRLLVSGSEQELLRENGVKIVAQIWGNNPEKFAESARFVESLGVFDGIDINMGCPVKNVVAHGSCSALIDKPELATAIIKATRNSTSLPLSVKTRLGVKQIETTRWISQLLELPIDALTIHGRIQKQMSDGEANWNEIGVAALLRNAINSNVVLSGNGDVEGIDDGVTRIAKSGVEGAMVGRGIFKNPWMFGSTEMPDLEKRLQTMHAHVSLFEATWTNTKNYMLLRRFLKIYVNGIFDAAYWRTELMKTNSYDEFYRVYNRICKTLL